MCVRKKRKRRFFSLALCMLVVIGVLFITSPAFADGEVPADGTDGGSNTAQTEEATESDQMTDVEDTGSAANDSSTEDVENSEEEQYPSSTEEGSGEEDVEETPVTEETPDEDEACDETGEQTDEDASDQEDEPGEGESSADDVVSDDTETGEDEDDGASSDEEAEETSETEDTQDEAAVELVDEEGEELDMASEEDADLASSGDPYWSVGKQYYSVAETEGGCYPGTSVAEGTCWVSSTPIATALEKIENDGLLPSDRKLYVKAGEYNGDLDISGVALGQLNGLVGVDGSGATIINGNVTIAYNTGGFSLSGFTINGGVEITDSTGNVVLEDLNVSNPSGDGIKVYNKEWYEYNESTGEYDIQVDGPKVSGTVKLEDVNSSNNQGMGAHIWAMSNITVNNSSFNNNGGTDGVDDPVDSLLLDNSWGTGSIYVSGVSAGNNNGTGIYIETSRNATLDSIAANSNTASSYSPGEDEKDYGYGLYLTGYTGKFKLENVFTNDNELIGMHVDGYKNTVLMTNMNASNNGDAGIEVYTQGALTIDTAQTDGNGADGIFAMIGKTVKLSSLIAYGNVGNGLKVVPYGIYKYDEVEEEYILSGYYGPTSVILTSPKSGGSTMANTFANNGEDGVYIQSKGTVTLSNLDAYGNGGRGIYVDNRIYDEEDDLYYGKGNVTVNVTIKGWINGVYENTDKGIEIYSLGVVKIYDTSVNGNLDDGIFVDTQNTIMLTDVTSESNGDYGAYLTTLSASKGKTVTITDSMFNSNGDTGLMVLTAGVINLKGSSASSNESTNSGGPLDFPISIHDIVYSTDATENWGFDGYSGDVLNIILESDDFDFTLTLYDSMNNVIADSSGSSGLPAEINVTLGSDDWYRIEVSQSGMTGSYGHYTLSVNDEDHEHNVYPGAGAVLDNSAGTAKVVISTTKYNEQNVFDNNQNYGLKINSNSSVVITGATASHNYSGGLSVVNPDSTGSVVVQDKSSEPLSNFDGNGLNGVNIQTQGTISLYGVSASYNGGSGLFLQNTFYDGWLGRGSITINMRKNTMGYFEGNEEYGITAASNGTINVTNVIANENGAGGVGLQNSFDNSTGSVNIKTSGSVYNEFCRNGWNSDLGSDYEYNGLTIYSNGNISVKNSIANDNSNQGSGMILQNESADKPRKVLVSSGETASNNGYGLQIETKGAVSIMNFNASQNGWNGIDVDACQEGEEGCEGSGSLKLSDVNAHENGGVGIQAHVMSVINLSRVYADSNGDKGIRLNNQFDGSNASVILKGITANDNNNTGILVTTNGAVTMNDLQADNNKKMSGYLNDGDAATDYYNDDAGSDRWDFDAESGVELIIRLYPNEELSLDNGFAGSLELYDDENNLITDYTVIGDGTGTGIQWTPSETGSYYVLVIENNQEDDFYQISINNETFENMEYYFADGMSIIAGKNVTLTGSTNSSFSDNSVSGLYVETPAHINLRCITADRNGTEGVYLDNFLADEEGNPTGYGKVNVAGRNDSLRSTFYENGWQGLSIRSNSVVSLQYLNAFYNGAEGILLGNADTATPESEDSIGGKVSVKFLDLFANGGDGLQISSLQNITLNSITANDNGSDGVYATTRYGTGGITVSGNNYFWNNYSSGIKAISNDGDVRLYGINARGNGSRGILGASYYGRVSLDRSHAQESGSTGIVLGSGVSVQVNRVTSMANGVDSDGDGILIQAYNYTPINIKSSTFVGNGGNGIEVEYMDSIGPGPVLTSTRYFGNDVDYDGTTEEANIYIHA